MTDQGRELSSEEDAILDDLLDGKFQSLIAYLLSGKRMSPELSDELGCMIGAGEVVLTGQSKQKVLAAQNGTKRKDRDRRIGAWVWVRHLRPESRGLNDIEDIAAGKFLVSKGTVHRCYVEYSKRRRSNDWFENFEDFNAYQLALREWCEEQGRDPYDPSVAANQSKIGF